MDAKKVQALLEKAETGYTGLSAIARIQAEGVLVPVLELLNLLARDAIETEGRRAAALAHLDTMTGKGLRERTAIGIFLTTKDN